MECIYDSSYPDIWDTPSEREAHLFETAEDCCEAWNCHTETVTPSDDGRWLSNEGGTDCVFMNLPEGMLDADWLFETRDGCCAVNTCPEIVTTTTTVATTTQDPTTTTTTTEATTTQEPTTTTTITEATTTQVQTQQWYPNFDSYDEVRLGCLRQYKQELVLTFSHRIRRQLRRWSAFMMTLIRKSGTRHL